MLSERVMQLVRHLYSNYSPVVVADLERDLQVPDPAGAWVNVARVVASHGIDFDVIWKYHYPKSGGCFWYFQKGDHVVAQWCHSMDVIVILKNPQPMPVPRNQMFLYADYDVVWDADK